MTRTLDNEYVQYMKFFSDNLKIQATHCFRYNGALIFVVKPIFMSKAIGKNGANIKNISYRLRRKIKIISEPSGEDKKDIEKFVSDIVYPIKFKQIILQEGEAVIESSPQSHALLIGRKKARLLELQKILSEYFDIKKLRISHASS